MCYGNISFIILVPEHVNHRDPVRNEPDGAQAEDDDFWDVEDIEHERRHRRLKDQTTLINDKSVMLL